ncbi:hypothetical protein JCM10908_000688 [Rhodotorula pacifica]|uniref:uncharacterized protein n=1 Tax=Rhodotorula pacifica TaxID=1495444 RepID=UPI003175D2C5
MPSADNPPSLLSRLSPAVPVPIQSSNNGPHASKGPFGVSPASPPVGSPPPFVGSPSRASRSPRKGNHFPRGAGHGPAHIASLPEDVLQKAQPIPVERSTNSSRWASSPPGPAAVVASSPSAARSPAKRTSNFLPGSASPRDVPGPMSIASPNSRSAGPASPSGSNGSPALGQLESMISQMRTASVSPPSHLAASRSPPPRSTPASPPLRAATSPRSPNSWLSKSPSSFRAAAMMAGPSTSPLSASPKAPAPIASSSPSASAARTPKKVLGGRSKWAVAGDDEPDEHASVAELRKQQKESDIPLQTPAKAQNIQEARSSPQPAAQQIQNLKAEETGEDLSKTPTPSASAAFAGRSPQVAVAQAETDAKVDEVGAEDDEDDEDDAPSTSSRRGSISSSAGSDAPSQSSSHINWADDDDDELPTLDDWGIDTTSTYTPSELGDTSPTTTTTTTGSSTPAAAALPNLGSKRHPNRSHRSPPAPTNAKPLLPPQSTPRPPPIKPNGRLFASAARAATGAAADLPPHLAARGSPHAGKSAPVAATPPPPPPTERSWRDRAAGAGGPSPAAFSRLSGLPPPAARKAGAPAATGAAPSTPTAAAATASPTGKASSSRKSKKGKSRGGAKSAEAHIAHAPAGSSKSNAGGGGGGGGGSKWA